MSVVRGKFALVTGGVSGIGLSTVRQLLKNGLKGVAIADINSVRGEQIVYEISEEFGPDRAIFIKTDVTVQQDVEDAFEKTIEVFKHLDIVINSAGIFDDLDWEKEVAINMKGTILVSLLAIDKYLPVTKSGDQAIILNVASILGLGSIEAMPIYAATKHAVIGFSTSLGTESRFKQTQVRVLTMCPGVTDTPIHHGAQERSRGPKYTELMDVLYEEYPVQKVEVVSEGIIRMIEEGRNGSVWVANDSKTFEVKLPDLLSSLKN